MENPVFKYKKVPYSLDIVYPNKYYGGVYNLGMLIIYNIVNKRENWNCNRVFLDKNKISSELVGFTLQYEPDLKNILEMKKQCNGITFAGGPVINANPEKFKKHFDFLLLGEAEESLNLILDEYEKDKENFLKNIKNIKGINTYNITEELGDYPLIQPFPEEINQDFVFGKPFILETERGCPFTCKFCILPNLYKKVRYRMNWKEIIDEGLKINKRNRVVIYSPSFTHPEKKQILQYLKTKGVRVTIPSIKVELMDKELLQLIKDVGQESLTIAPECNETLRKTLGKLATDNIYFKFIQLCNEIKIKKLKVYLIIGLPNQTEQDIIETREFIDKLNKEFNGKLYLSINYFVPKPRSLFENHEFNKAELKKQKKIAEREFKHYKIKITGLSSSALEYKISKTGSL
ncbi:MAG: radical SAM protein [archaeon]